MSITDPSTQRWAANLRMEMARQRVTGQELAKRAGVTHQTISHWRHGACTPNHRHKEALAKALGCTVSKLYAWYDEDVA